MSCFENNVQECDHLINGTRYQSVNTTAWEDLDEFEACRDICVKCGKTVQIWIRNQKGLRELFRL